MTFFARLNLYGPELLTCQVPPILLTTILVRWLLRIVYQALSPVSPVLLLHFERLFPHFLDFVDLGLEGRCHLAV